MIRLLFFILLLLPFKGYTGGILASTKQVSSIISMVDKDAKIEVISSNNSCPAHYSLKPSDIAKIEEAELSIYINEKFEPFTEVIKSKSKGKIVRLSDHISGNIRNNNYHFWLDIEMVKTISNEVAKLLGKDFDASELDQLLGDKKKIFSAINNPVLLSSSLEYLFDDTGINPQRFYIEKNNMSINLLGKMQQFPANSTFIASDNFDSLAQKSGIKIIYIDCGKWPKDDYIKHYRNMLEKLRNESI